MSEWKGATLEGGSLPASFLTLMSTTAAGTSDYIVFKTGSQTEALRIDTSGNIKASKPVVPNSNDGAALGTTALMWSDLFLASGAVINFNNGDVTLTHSANTLAFAGASSGYSFDAGATFGGAVTPVSSDGAALGTASVMWSDLFLASGAVVNFNNGDVTITHGANTLTFAGAASGYAFDSSIKSSSASGGVGYSTGAGGTITQLSSKSTGVQLDTITGQITTNNSILNASSTVGFTLTNASIAATDVVVLCIASGATLNSYILEVDAVATGSCHIKIRNTSGSNLSEALVINFAVIKGVAS